MRLKVKLMREAPTPFVKTASSGPDEKAVNRFPVPVWATTVEASWMLSKLFPYATFLKGQLRDITL